MPYPRDSVLAIMEAPNIQNLSLRPSDLLPPVFALDAR